LELIPLPQFRVRKTYEEVADYLREQILSGVHQPGERLPSLRVLGEQLGVGQSTLREAISSLKTVGLLTIKQGEGTFVAKFEPEEILSAFESITPITRQDIVELLEVRKIIEVGTVRLAAERRTEEDLAMMDAAIEEMETALESGDLGDQADLKFHIAIAHASHNDILNAVMVSISETMEHSVRANRLELYKTPGVPEQLYREHLDIGEAIRQQNPGRAVEAMLYHLVGVEKRMLK
jgi:GntR family transcriptional regulator, transcriptional repressor for pyruvate dehydrogenase complex